MFGDEEWEGEKAKKVVEEETKLGDEDEDFLCQLDKMILEHAKVSPFCI